MEWYTIYKKERFVKFKVPKEEQQDNSSIYFGIKYVIERETLHNWEIIQEASKKEIIYKINKEIKDIKYKISRFNKLIIQLNKEKARYI